MIPDVISPINTDPPDRTAEHVFSGWVTAPPLFTIKVIPRMSWGRDSPEIWVAGAKISINESFELVAIDQSKGKFYLAHIEPKISNNLNIVTLSMSILKYKSSFFATTLSSPKMRLAPVNTIAAMGKQMT